MEPAFFNLTGEENPVAGGAGNHFKKSMTNPNLLFKEMAGGTFASNRGGMSIATAKGQNLNAVKAYVQAQTADAPQGTPNEDLVSLQDNQRPADDPYHTGTNDLRVKHGAIIDGRPVDVVYCGELTFTIPLFSGIFGVLMPQDQLRYLPLMYFPNLEFEFVFNEYAFHSSRADSTRSYTITKLEMFSNMLTFEHDIHQQLDDIVSQTGIHIVSQSFISGPPLQIPSMKVNPTFPITLPLKSVKSIYLGFRYQSYKNDVTLRQDNNVSHNIRQLQVRVGATKFFPSLPIEGHAGDSTRAMPFLIELLKSTGRMHDITTDSNISTDNYCIDTPYSGNLDYYMASLGITGTLASDRVFSSEWEKKYLRNGINSTPVGRCVYGISMQNISSDTSTLSGVNTVVASPFEVLLNADDKASPEVSVGYSFVNHDFILYISPKLDIRILGR